MQSSRFLPVFLSQTKPARGNTPFATIRLPPRGSFSFERVERALEMGGGKGCTRASPARSFYLTCSCAGRAQRVPEAEDSRRNHHHTRFACDKKKSGRMPFGSPCVHCVSRMHTRARSTWHGREARTRPHVVPYESMMLHTRKHAAWSSHSTLSAACRRRGDKDGDPRERAR